MIIPPDALIREDKLTNYLLAPREADDKSGYLAQAGFSLENPDDLLLAIRNLVADKEAILDRLNRFGEYYRVDGILVGPNGRKLSVTTIWLKDLDHRMRFVTLKPKKGTKT